MAPQGHPVLSAKLASNWALSFGVVHYHRFISDRGSRHHTYGYSHTTRNGNSYCARRARPNAPYGITTRFSNGHGRPCYG